MPEFNQGFLTWRYLRSVVSFSPLSSAADFHDGKQGCQSNIEPALPGFPPQSVMSSWCTEWNVNPCILNRSVSDFFMIPRKTFNSMHFNQFLEPDFSYFWSRPPQKLKLNTSLKPSPTQCSITTMLFFWPILFQWVWIHLTSECNGCFGGCFGVSRKNTYKKPFIQGAKYGGARGGWAPPINPWDPLKASKTKFEGGLKFR